MNQLKNLFSLSKDERFTVCMDIRQSLEASISSVDFIKGLFKKRAPGDHDLVQSYRCDGKVLAFAKAVTELRIESTDSKKRAESEILVTNNEGEVALIESSEAMDFMKRMAMNVNTCIITGKKDKDRLSAIKDDKGRQVFTQVYCAHDVKGLQYEQVILYEPMKDDVFAKLDKLIDDQGKINEAGRDNKYSTPLCKLFTNITRAKNRIYIIQSDLHKVSRLLRRLDVVKLDKDSNNKPNVSTEDEFYSRAEELIKTGGEENLTVAESILINNCNMKQSEVIEMIAAQEKAKVTVTSGIEEAINAKDLSGIEKALKSKRVVNYLISHPALCNRLIQCCLSVESLNLNLIRRLCQPDMSPKIDWQYQDLASGNTLLHMLAKDCHLKNDVNVNIIDFVLKDPSFKVGVNIFDKDGYSAFALALERKNLLMIEALLKYSAYTQQRINLISFFKLGADKKDTAVAALIDCCAEHYDDPYLAIVAARKVLLIYAPNKLHALGNALYKAINESPKKDFNSEGIQYVYGMSATLGNRSSQFMMGRLAYLIAVNTNDSALFSVACAFYQYAISNGYKDTKNELDKVKNLPVYSKYIENNVQNPLNYTEAEWINKIYTCISKKMLGQLSEFVAGFPGAYKYFSLPYENNLTVLSFVCKEYKGKNIFDISMVEKLVIITPPEYISQLDQSNYTAFAYLCLRTDLDLPHVTQCLEVFLLNKGFNLMTELQVNGDLSRVFIAYKLDRIFRYEDFDIPDLDEIKKLVKKLIDNSAATASASVEAWRSYCAIFHEGVQSFSKEIVNRVSPD